MTNLLVARSLNSMVKVIYSKSFASNLARSGTKVKIVEVGPRDGLQNEKSMVASDVKVELISKLAEAGLSCIETTSFVSPKWVPQMADAKVVLSSVLKKYEQSNIDFPVLTPNLHGYESAVAIGAKEVAIFAAASEAFSQKNINCSIEKSIERFVPIMASAKRDGVKVRGYVSTVIACPYSGVIPPEKVGHVVKRLLDIGCYEVSLGDTIGAGSPRKIEALMEHLINQLGLEPKVLALHCHDTYGTALSNIQASLKYGIRTFDASVGGLGGCPYAPGATGNVATEDVAYMLHGDGYETGIDLIKLAQVGQWISGKLSRPNASRAGRALLSKYQAKAKV